jgi:hypothetical protein
MAEMWRWFLAVGGARLHHRLRIRLGHCLGKQLIPETRDAVARIRLSHAKSGEHVGPCLRVF